MNLFGRSRPLNLPMVPLVAVCIGVILAAIPLFGQAAGWASFLLFAAMGARLFLNRKAIRLPSLPLKVVLFGLGMAGVAATYGGMLGIEPGLSILFVLVSLKIVETNGERDFQVLVLLGCFLGLCGLFFSQDLLLWLYIGGVFLLLMSTLVRFQTGEAGSFFAASRMSVTLLLQAIPIIVLLFVAFPRSYGGFRFQFSRSLISSTGMSDRLAPGSIASLTLNTQDVAFRVDFPDRNAPPLSQLYWRGAVFWRGDGLTWVPGPLLRLEPRMGQYAGEPIRQRISLQPHGGRWLFALDRPLGNQSRFEFMPGRYIQSNKLLFSKFSYEVISQPENREQNLLPEHRAAGLALPGHISPRVRALVESWKQEGQTDRELVERALHYFRMERFRYTLEPGAYGDNALDEFLFERRAGFCEHYAASFATLMRVAGIPARVVVGYHGGEYNRLGNYVIVHQSDAHAWTEVWIKDTGWLRVDPTDVIAPDRISSGFSSYLESQADNALNAGGSSTAALGLREIMREFRLVWDSINYQWDLRVLNFNEDEQRTFFAQLGFSNEQWPAILTWTGVLILVALALVALWLRRGGRVPLDEAGRAWKTFGAILQKAGVQKEPWEGPLRFGQRAAEEVSEHRAAILEVATLYAEIRYSPRPPSVKKLTEAVRRLPRFQNAGKTSPGK